MNGPLAQDETLKQIIAEIQERLGFCPSFFLATPESPEIIRGLWQQTRHAYLDNPIPPLLKEKLFAHLSRFCSVPYCMARHSAFLLGYGRRAGDAVYPLLSPEDVLGLIRQPLPTPDELDAYLRTLRAAGPLDDWPAAGGDLERSILSCTVPVFLGHSDQERCQQELRRTLGAVRSNHLLVLLAFIHSAHFWAETHPDLAFEPDVERLLDDHPALAEWLRAYPTVVTDELEERAVGERTKLRVDRAKLRRTEEELRRMSKVLQESEARFRALIDSAADGIVTINELGIIESANPAAERQFGYSAQELIGRNVSILMPHPHRQLHDRYIRRYLNEGNARIIGIGRELVAVKRDGSTFPIHLTITELLVDGKRVFAGFLRDLTEQRQLEEQYRHSQKLEALGTLTGGIAHDFGNLLTGIIGCSNIALRKVGEESPAAVYITELSEAAKRGSGLIRQLLSFSRKQKAEFKPLDLGAVVKNAEPLLRRLLGDDIELQLDLADAGLMITADAGQLEQILVNLIVNARDAMPEGGRLAVWVGHADLGEREAKLHGLKSAGRYSTLSVTDDGVGMDPETKSRVFEPFFTTKAPGRGTGLGLSTVYGITKQFGGSVEVQSDLGQGSVFTFYFPMYGAAEVERNDERPRPTTGNQRILLVEDERLVRLTVRHYLEALGYRVVEAGEPNEALGRLERSAADFDLLLTDVVMPGFGGKELAHRARSIRPGIRVLLMSAHPREELLARGSLSKDDDLLGKPFSQGELARAIRRVLDRPVSGRS